MNHTVKIVLICSVVFLLQILFPSVEQFGALRQEPFFVWMILTHMFLHADIAHFLMNMLTLLIFGSILEHLIGKKFFLIVYFGSGITTGIVSVFFYDAAVGASAAIFGVLGALTIIRPSMLIWIQSIPVPLWFGAIIYTIANIILTLIPTNIAGLAHLIGLFSGMFMGIPLRKVARLEKSQKHTLVKAHAQKFIDPTNNQKNIRDADVKTLQK